MQLKLSFEKLAAGLFFFFEKKNKRALIPSNKKGNRKRGGCN